MLQPRALHIKHTITTNELPRKSKPAKGCSMRCKLPGWHIGRRFWCVLKYCPHWRRSRRRRQNVAVCFWRRREKVDGDILVNVTVTIYK